MPKGSRPEIEETETEIIFHCLSDVGASGRREVRAASAPVFAQPNAPGGLRRVWHAGAWDLGAFAAMEDERLFGTED
ncbi:MAG: hypothetical protein OXM56_06955 [Gammaproteobacteria bacterium]|nr:hypothetical protein [Gammaproteobacteria bacterium]